MYALRPDRMQLAIPVIAILHDHLDVPSIVICSACSIESMCVSGSTENVVLRAGTGNKNTDTTTYEHSRRSFILSWEEKPRSGVLSCQIHKLAICPHNGASTRHLSRFSGARGLDYEILSNRTAGGRTSRFYFRIYCFLSKYRHYKLHTFDFDGIQNLLRS
jgi:hypothetical protein